MWFYDMGLTINSPPEGSSLEEGSMMFLLLGLYQGFHCISFELNLVYA